MLQKLYYKIITRRFFYFYLNYLSFNDLTLFFYSDSNRSSKGLSQSLCFAHLKRKYLWTRQHSKGNILSQTLSHSHSNCSFTCARLSTDQNRPPCNLSFFYHFEDDTCCSSGVTLNNLLITCPTIPWALCLGSND